MAAGAGAVAVRRARPSAAVRLYARYEPVVLGAAGVVLLFVLWEAAGALGVIDPRLFGQPSRLVPAAAGLWGAGVLQHHVSVTLTEFALGFTLAVLVGIPMGFLMGWYRGVEYVLEPFVWFLYSSPLVAFYPLFIVWFGIGMPTVVTIAFLLAVFPLLINTVTGVQHVEAALVRAARSFGARDLEIFLKVSLPASLPIVFAGLRLAVGRALVGVVVGEIFGATAGLGFAVRYWGGRLRIPEVFVFLTCIALLGVVLTQLIRLLEGRLLRWRHE
ncbi:MAG: ABC transporter permease [Deltaproteobacteria bacterium]|nr:ABC transporter permease [Deltaproteobacteria bacterium]MBI3079539.1 ABC transporter permease [Deltaproteobacteria bacterium]